MNDAPRWKGLPQDYYEKPVEAAREDWEVFHGESDPCKCGDCLYKRYLEGKPL